MKSHKWQNSSTREEVEMELLRLRELEEAAYGRLRQEEALVRALKSEFEVMVSLKDPDGDGEEQLQIANKRKILEESIEVKELKVEELREDAKRAYTLTRRQTGMRNSFKESEERIAKATAMRDDRRKTLGPWRVLKMRVKDVVNLGSAGYGAEKRRREMLGKARHVLKCEKSLQNSLVTESKMTKARLKWVDEELAKRPARDVQEGDVADGNDFGVLPPLKQLVEQVHAENGKLMELKGTYKQAYKEKEKWERSKEDNAQGMVISSGIKLSILEETMAEQQRVVQDKEKMLGVCRERIKRGGEETEQERFAREKYERNNLENEKKNLEIKWQDCESAVRSRFISVGELRREAEQAQRYQETAGARVAFLEVQLAKISKWQKVAVEVRRALQKERDGLIWQVKYDLDLSPDVRLAMQEKVDAMINQLEEEKAKAENLTVEKAELERELDLLQTRIQQSKDDVAY